jgi:hypothetical protein
MSLEDFRYQLQQFWGRFVGKPRSLQTLSLRDGNCINYLPHKWGEAFEGYIICAEGTPIHYTQGLDIEFFCRPGGLFDSSHVFEELNNSILRQQNVRIFRVAPPSANDYHLVAAYPDGPIVFTRLITTKAEERSMFEILSTHTPSKENLSWAPVWFLSGIECICTILLWNLRLLMWWKVLLPVGFILLVATAIFLKVFEVKLPSAPGEEAFREISKELTVAGKDNPKAFGSSQTLERKAITLQELLQVHWDDVRGDRTSRSGSMTAYRVIVYWGEHKETQIILVHPGGIGILDEEEMVKYEKRVFDMACSLIESDAQSPQSIAVGIRGFLTYSSILRGNSKGAIESIDRSDPSASQLYPYFIEEVQKPLETKKL